MRVYTYWEGKRTPLIDLCLESIQKHCPTAEVWTKQRFADEYDGMVGPWDRIAKQAPNIQSDVLRAWLLYTRGGCWVDADCIVFSDLDYLKWTLHYGKENPGVCAYQDSGEVFTALLCSVPKGIVMWTYCMFIEKALKSRGTLPFQAIGPHLFRRAIVACLPCDVTDFIAMELIHPVRWKSTAGQLFYTTNAKYNFAEDAYGFMLVTAVRDLHAGKSRSTLLKDQTIVGQALRHAGLE